MTETVSLQIPAAPRTIDEAKAILALDQGPLLTLMEVCGTHTSAIAASGLRSLLSKSVRLVSGPGCPVCVTPSSYIDRLCELALQPGHLVLCFGDLIRVPGHHSSLSEAMASGGQVRMIYSPLDALKICQDNPNLSIVMAAVGFETTAPSYALLLKRAIASDIRNLRLLTALRRMPPALDLLCAAENAIDGFLAPGHVSAILGSKAYEPFAAQYHKPFVIAGFQPTEVLIGIARLVQLCRLEKDRQADGRGGIGIVENLYPAIVRPEGNPRAQAVLAEVFRYEPAIWRGLGEIDESGYRLAGDYAAYDAGPLEAGIEQELPGCKCGDMMLGRLEPRDCPLFGKTCRPDHPVGPCMVSSEGVCGIHYRYSEQGY
jgi:hydrogenase expression/formation protein HypD